MAVNYMSTFNFNMDYRDPDWVAEKLGIEKNTVYRFLQDGTIPALQLGRKWLVSERRLIEWLEQETDRQTRARRDSTQPAAPEVARRLDDYTAAGRQVLKRAHTEARTYGHEQLDTGHLLLAIALDSRSAAARAVRELGLTPESIRLVLEQRLAPGTQPAARRLPRAPEAKRAMRLASKLAQKHARDGATVPVGTDHLLAGVLLARRGLGAEILTQHGVTRRRLKQALRPGTHHGETEGGE